MRTIKVANIFRYTARIALLTLGTLVFVFGLISGAENSEGITTFSGIIKNSPNALPGFALLIFTAIAWKNELIGGIIVTLFGLFLVYFFNTGSNFFLTTFIVMLLITLMGLLFIGSWSVRRKKTKPIQEQ